MARKKEITAARSFGAVSKAKVFEELIWLVCGKRVKLKPAPVGGEQSGISTNSKRENGTAGLAGNEYDRPSLS